MWRLHRGVLDASELSVARRMLEEEYDELPHMAHSRLLWYVRTLPQVQRLFAEWWGGETKLATSFDGMSWRRPGEGNAWTLPWHVDQDDPQERGVQGILALSPQDARSGGLQFAAEWTVEDFETLAATVAEKKPWPFVVQEEQERKHVHPTLAPGDVLLWDSRLLHRVVAPTDEACERATVYLAFQPKDPKLTVERTRAFMRGVSTNHWSRRVVPRPGAGEARTALLTPAVAALL